MTFDQVLQEERPVILRIAAKHGARNVRVFGSVARGEVDEQSDITLISWSNSSPAQPARPRGALASTARVARLQGGRGERSRHQAAHPGSGVERGRATVRDPEGAPSRHAGGHRPDRARRRPRPRSVRAGQADPGLDVSPPKDARVMIDATARQRRWESVGSLVSGEDSCIKSGRWKRYGKSSFSLTQVKNHATNL